MKKLFLFILILFGMISIRGLAAGCNAQICMCPGGGYVTTGQYCPVYNNAPSAPRNAPPVNFYLFVVPTNNKPYGLVDLNTTDFLKALPIGCYEGRICSKVTIRDYIAVVASDDGRIFTGSSDTFHKGSAKQAEKQAKKDCKEGKESNGKGYNGDGIKGKNCKLIMTVSPNFKFEDRRTGEKYDLKVTDSIKI